MSFESTFKELTGYEPLHWQKRLYGKHFAKEQELPSAVSVPTGLGKTAVMAVWLIALAEQMKAGKPKLPRRLVYVVDRRTVVDQATRFAELLRENLSKADGLAAALGLGEGESLPISTLRGQFVDNREWLNDPAKPAIIIGTVDLIGSRLLFEGYGVSRKMRPYHAGVLGADVLVLLDEAHLVPPFEALLAEIANNGERYGAKAEPPIALIPKFKLLPLSATGRRETVQPFVLEEKDFRNPDDALVIQRLSARKHLKLEELGDRKLEAALAERAWSLSGEGKEPVRVIIYCNSRDVAEKVKNALDDLIKKAKGSPAAGRTELFVGARRVKERVDAEQRLHDLGFLAGSGEQTAPAFLVATSAGEVGVDLDADHMVCDLVAWERMVQRFGRVNRRGGEGRQAEIVVVDEGEPKPKKPEQPTEDEKTRIRIYQCVKKLFEKLRSEGQTEISVSPEALRQLSEPTRADDALAKLITDASSPAPLRPALNRALVDAWAMTSLPEHTGRPEVAPWLRGWVTDEPQTTVVWRKHLPVRDKDQTQPSKKEIEDFFEAAPIHASETLETESRRQVVPWLQQRTAALGDDWKPDNVVGMVLGNDGKLVQVLKFKDMPPAKSWKDDDKKKFEVALFDKTLVMDARFGGLKDGLLNKNADDVPVTADNGQSWVTTDDGKPLIRFRILERGDESDETAEKEWLESLRFDQKRSEDGEATRWLSIQKWRDTSNNENDRAAGQPQSLTEHQAWAEKRAGTIGGRMALPDAYRNMLCIAARLHDEGKKAVRWQRAFRAERDAKKFGIEGPLAKTRGPINQALLDGYRHEFGSLRLAQDDAEFKKLPEELQDLALHLIAAHHGFARPLIATSGSDDAPPSMLGERACEVALRYARLQERWGPWGLAWWESLLRAADVQASRANDEKEQA